MNLTMMLGGDQKISSTDVLMHINLKKNITQVFLDQLETNFDNKIITIFLTQIDQKYAKTFKKRYSTWQKNNDTRIVKRTSKRSLVKYFERNFKTKQRTLVRLRRNLDRKSRFFRRNDGFFQHSSFESFSQLSGFFGD